MECTIATMAVVVEFITGLVNVDVQTLTLQEKMSYSCQVLYINSYVSRVIFFAKCAVIVFLERGRSIHKTYSSAESQYHAAVVGAGKVIFAKKLHREKCQNLHILLTTK